MNKQLGLTPDVSAQLALNLQIEEIADAMEDQNIDPTMAHQISNSARAALEDGAVGEAAWVEDYKTLVGDGWPWRVAAWIAWSASPRQVGDKERWPGTQMELARNVLGLRSDRVIRKWRAKNPAIDQAVALLQMQPLLNHRRAIIDALVTSASTPDYKNHNDRKLALEMTGDYLPRTETKLSLKANDDLSQLTDAELETLARNAKGDEA